MKIVVVGPSGVIGTEVAKQLEGRHEVIRASRTTSTHHIDITKSDTISECLEHIGRVDALVCAAGDNKFAPMNDLTDADFAFGFASKVMGQVNLARIGQRYVRDNGSITLTSGVTGRQPIPGTTSIAMNNSAIEGFVRAAALEMPRGIRINAVCPQWSIATLEKYGMDPSWGVPAELIAQGYVASVEGTMTGTVIDAGWRSDASANSMTLVATGT
jgi:NAD(P)-dependent dehydrogenase (short-subunit alcohol dehydrogenase family)